MFDEIKKALDSICDETFSEDAGTSAGAKKGWYRRKAVGVVTPQPWKNMPEYVKNRVKGGMYVNDAAVAEDYGTSEGAVKAAQTRKSHVGMSPLMMRYMQQKIGKEFGNGTTPAGAGIPVGSSGEGSGRHNGQPHGLREAFFAGKFSNPQRAEDAQWEETKHHRADNGRFTSGSGRGKVKGEEADGNAESRVKDGKRKEIGEEEAMKIVRSAFASAKKELKGAKMVGHAIKADTDSADEESCRTINAYLGRHGLKADVDGKTTFKIAEDGYDDIQVVDDPMLEVLVDLCRIDMVAKDLHYRAQGKPFYGIHLLADLVKGVSDSADDLNEVYYMGEKQQDPPERAFVSEKAAGLVGRAGDEGELIAKLAQVCDETAKAVENAKNVGVASGTAAVLDDISKKALQAKGLIARTMKVTANRDAIDRVVGKGIVIG